MAPSHGSDSPRLVSNPFIKKRNLEWRLSPPPTRKKQRPEPLRDQAAATRDSRSPPPSGTHRPAPNATSLSSAAIEAGKAKITDHLSHFSQLLGHLTLDPYPPATPRLALSTYRSLYDAALQNPHGAHFVIHQHDHPVAGPHYDLRLQINGTSSVSWAIMYGLPGDPNSQRLNRNAAETRIHTLWNHLVETGSRATGSLLIWDSGTFQVLPRRSKHAPAIDPDSEGDASEDEGGGIGGKAMTEQEKLHAAFANRKIRLRLNGTKLPRPYVLNLRITKKEDAAGRTKALRVAAGAPPKRRRRRAAEPPKPAETSGSDPNSESEHGMEVNEMKTQAQKEEEAKLSAMEKELRELEDEEVRKSNAYSGASNTIGSVYQRRWYLSLERSAIGFVRRRKKGEVVWEKDPSASKQMGSDDEKDDMRLRYPFYVKGPEHERSVVTGRLGHEILRDEGVPDYVGRKGWRPVLY